MRCCASYLYQAGLQIYGDKTALITAAQDGYLDIVKLLAFREAGIFVYDHYNALRYSLRFFQFDVSQYLATYDKEIIQLDAPEIIKAVLKNDI